MVFLVTVVLTLAASDRRRGPQLARPRGSRPALARHRTTPAVSQGGRRSRRTRSSRSATRNRASAPDVRRGCRTDGGPGTHQRPADPGQRRACGQDEPDGGLVAQHPDEQCQRPPLHRVILPTSTIAVTAPTGTPRATTSGSTGLAVPRPAAMAIPARTSAIAAPTVRKSRNVRCGPKCTGRPSRSRRPGRPRPGPSRRRGPTAGRCPPDEPSSLGSRSPAPRAASRRRWGRAGRPNERCRPTSRPAPAPRRWRCPVTPRPVCRRGPGIAPRTGPRPASAAAAQLAASSTSAQTRKDASPRCMTRPPGCLTAAVG